MFLRNEYIKLYNIIFGSTKIIKLRLKFENELEMDARFFNEIIN